MIQQEALLQAKRARRLLDHVLRPAVYTDHRLLDVLVYQTEHPIPYEQAIRQSYKAVQLGFLWGPVWSTAWFRLEGIVPQEWTGQPFRLLFDTRTEACCWWDGHPYQGVELHRQDIKLPDCVAPGHRLRIHIEAACNHMLGIGTEFGDQQRIGKFPDLGGGVLKQAHLALYHPKRAGLAEDLDVLIGLMEASTAAHGDLSVHDPARTRRLLSTLRRVCALIDHDFEARQLDRDLMEARELCAQAFNVEHGASRNVVTAVGHAHIDLAWLWPIRETKRKASRTFSTVLRYMERNTDYCFMQSMPQLYEWVREDYPNLFEQIKSRIASGQWEVGGAMWVEPDCNTPSGESLTRQLLYGMRYCRDVLGAEPSYLFLPDVFGYSAALPQLIKLAGLDAFITQKISWNDTNCFPHHSFIWYGQDGTPVLSHFLPANDYNATNSPVEVALADARYAQSGEAPVWLQCYGHGDGGGGPTESHIERVRRLNDAEGLPSVHMGRIDAFLNQLHSYTDLLPEWHGELYLELHRGTYTTQANLKRLNRRLEDALRDAEFALVCLGSNAEQRSRIEQLWKCLLLNQFHDILPGSSIGWVVRQATEELTEALAAAREVLHTYHDDSSERIPSVLNTTGHAQDGPVNLQSPIHGVDVQSGKDLEGKPYHIALLSDPVNAYTSRPIDALTFSSPDTPATYDGLTLDNGLLRVQMDEAGRVISLRHAEREWVDAENPANQLILFADLPRYWDAWDIDDTYRERFEVLAKPARHTITAAGPLRVELEFKRPIGLASELIQRIRLDAGQPMVIFDTLVRWHETNTLLRVEHPVGVFTESARYETQFGHVSRPNHRNTSWDAAKFEVCAQRWMDISDPDAGVSLLNDCKYGHSCHGNTIGMSLLRSSKAPDPDADIGQHRFLYALLPHDRFDAHYISAQAEALNRPLKHLDIASLSPPFHVVDQLGVVVDTVKPTINGDGAILRLYESRGAPGWIDLAWHGSNARVDTVNLLEEPIDPSSVKIDNHRSRISLRPFEVRTLRLTHNA